jgi:hypothetical protein
MPRFISTKGPDAIPDPPGIDVRFWGSVISWADALALKAQIDPLLPAGTKTYVVHALVRRDLPERANLFEGTAPVPYWGEYIDGDLNQHTCLAHTNEYKEIGFDVFSAPEGVAWKTICETATDLLNRFSSSPPGGQA